MNEARNYPLPIEEFSIGDRTRVLCAPTAARDVVVIEGSVLGGPNMFSLEQSGIAVLTAHLLDAGTVRASKKVIRERLARRGASLVFSAAGDRTQFSGRCFPEDLPMVLATATECLSDAVFPASEVRTARAIMAGTLRDEEANTRALAERALTALLYDPTHVNYLRSAKEEQKSVANIRRADVQQFQKTLGTGGLVLAVAGDIRASDVRRAAERAFGKLREGTRTAQKKHANRRPARASEERIPIDDKANVDVLVGAALPFTLHDPLYHPMKIVADLLGGGVTAHLMQTLRERDGLTYGAYAHLSGFTDGADGYLKVWATFSSARYEASMTAMREELRSFFSKGLTTRALARAQERLAGSYLVSLSTTRNLAALLHMIGAEGLDLSYVSEYPDKIRAVSLKELRHAASLIPLSKLSIAASGTFT